MEILNYQEGAAGSNVVATFDLYWPKIGVSFRRMKLFKSKKGSVFVAYPSYGSEPDAFGQKKWTEYFFFDKDREFKASVMEALQPYLKSKDCRPSDGLQSSLPFDTNDVPF